MEAAADNVVHTSRAVHRLGTSRKPSVISRSSGGSNSSVPSLEQDPPVSATSMVARKVGERGGKGGERKTET